VRSLQNAPFCPISASDSNFNPRNTQCIPVVKIIALLELEQKYAFFKGLYVRFVPQDLRALNLDLFTLPSDFDSLQIHQVLVLKLY